MLHKIGLAYTVILLALHWGIGQISTVTDLKDFIDAGFTVVSLWIFLWYMMSKEKARDQRQEKTETRHREEIAHHRLTIQAKDEEIKRLNDKANGR